ncbi:MAG: hypothetical protein H7Y05_07305, partial [Steroidobacteraceae bacterium]|nr:hypothetical protein [Deltaproteobacteria bacterium]
MKKIRQYLIWMVMLTTVLLSLGVSHAATWSIGNYDGLTIDDAGISTTSGAPFGETSWVIRFGSGATDNYDPMWREWMWYRIGTTDQEASFSTLPASGAYNTDSSAVTLTFNDSQVPARFNATVTFGVAEKTTYSYNSNVKKTLTI